MAAKTLAELLVAETKDQVNQRLLAELQKAGFPITDWAPGAVEKTLIATYSTVLNDLSAAMIPTIAAGGLTDYATGDWLTLLSKKIYDNDRHEATRTVGEMVLTCATGAGPYAISVGQLWAAGATGNRYSNKTSGTLRAPGFSSVTHVGPGTGTVATSGSGGNDTGLQIKIEIIGSGGLGAGTFRWSSDGGTTYGPTTTIPGGGSHTDSASGITITFTGTFTAGDTYAFDSYGKLRPTFESEFPNDSTNGRNYTDPSGTITTLQTPLPGVAINNPASAYSAVGQIGTGSGTLKFSGTPTGTHAVTVRIDISGQSGAATWSTSVDGGSFASQGSAASVTNLGGFGINIELQNGGGTPSFVAGDTYSFTVPGTWITTQGTDKEADPALNSRDRARWPELGKVPSEDVYAKMARDASVQVTKVHATPDPTVNNKVLIYVGGQAGVLPSSTIADVQNYINKRVGLTDVPLVQSPTPRTISLTGFVVTVEIAALAAAQAAMQAALSQYINGDTNINGLLRLAEIIDLIMDIPGVVDLSTTTATISGANSGANLQLPITPGAFELPQWSQSVASAFTWLTV